MRLDYKQIVYLDTMKRWVKIEDAVRTSLTGGSVQHKKIDLLITHQHMLMKMLLKVRQRLMMH